MSNSKTLRWVPIDKQAASELTAATASPGQVFPIGTNALPHQLQVIPGVSAYYVSASLLPHFVANGISIGGEMVIQRSDAGSGGVTTKNYNAVFGTSTDGCVCFAHIANGINHHITSGQSAPIASLFTHPSFTNQKGP